MDWDAMYEQEKRAGAASGSRASASRTDVFGDIDADVNMDNDNGFGDADDIDMGRQNQQRGGNKSAQAREAEEEEEAFGKTPLGMLTRHWVNERHAPDILPAQEELLGGLLDHLRVQVSMNAAEIFWCLLSRLQSGPLQIPLFLSADRLLLDEKCADLERRPIDIGVRAHSYHARPN